MSFTDWFWKVSCIYQRLVGLTHWKKERKNHAACVLVILLPALSLVCYAAVFSVVTQRSSPQRGALRDDTKNGCVADYVITGKIVEDEAIYDSQRFLVEDFFLLVIKPPGTFLNNELLPSCKLFFPRYQRSSACSAGSNSFWQTLHWKLRRAATFLNTQCTFLARFLQQQLE